MNVAYNMDCLEAMRKMKDNEFDLAVVDPPYGGGGTQSALTQSGSVKRTGGTWAARYEKITEWDVAPEKEYFDELFRVSRNQIIWGGNYFDLPPTRCFIIWDKTNVPENFSMAMAEYAWTSFNANAKIARLPASGQKDRFHPTQKPIALYKWIYKNYANAGDKILDTHLGSGSSRIAAHDMGFDFVGYEIDPEYFERQEARFNKHTEQLNFFIKDWGADR